MNVAAASALAWRVRGEALGMAVLSGCLPLTVAITADSEGYTIAIAPNPYPKETE